MRTPVATGLSVTLLALAGVVAPAAPARASCEEAGHTSYAITDVVTTRTQSNLASDYLRGPGAISYSTTKTAQVATTASVEAKAEIGRWLAKAEVTTKVQLASTWTKSGTWSYGKQVPAGRTARLTMWHESRSFTVRKTTVTAPCTVRTVWTSHAVVPRAADLNVWDLQYA